MNQTDEMSILGWPIGVLVHGICAASFVFVVDVVSFNLYVYKNAGFRRCPVVDMKLLGCYSAFFLIAIQRCGTFFCVPSLGFVCLYDVFHLKKKAIAFETSCTCV